MRWLAAFFLAAGLSAQSNPIELIPAPQPKTWTVTHLLQKPQVTYPSGTLLQLRNPSFSAGSYAKVISEPIPVDPAFGKEPGKRIYIVARQESQIQNGHDACWWEIKDHRTGATLGIYRGQTKDEVVAFSVKIPPQKPYPEIKNIIVLWHPKISPLGIWRITGISAFRTHGPSVKLIANPNLLDLKVERSNFGGYAYGVVGSFTRLPARINLSGFVGTGLLVSPDVILPLPLQPVISHDTALIGVLRRIHWQAIEVGPAFALGWASKG